MMRKTWLTGLSLMLLFSAGSAMASDKPILIAQRRADHGGVGDGAWQLLKKPMDLPDLPKYGGQTQFVGGLMYPNKPGGPAITMRYLTTDAPAVVSQWYEDSLKANTWSTTSIKDTIKGQKGHNGVMVRVSPSTQKGYKSEIKISYKLYR
ncbi:MAG: hypothetical protein KC777_02885 [Cyanobacteria bacterium HKST-UBA02]|nr:hypothetical protein [Cyanobacteria bacterium HKST-UBA02]